MALNAYDRYNHFSEIADPLNTQEGVLSPANQRLRALRNLRTGLGGLVAPMAAATSLNTAGAVTYTAAQMLSGTIVRDCNGGARTDTLPTAALLVAAISGAAVGDIVETLIINGSDAAEVLTLAAGAGGAFDANQLAATRIVGQNTSKRIRVRLTNVTSGAEAYVVYA